MTQTPPPAPAPPARPAPPSRPAPAVGHSATRSTVPPPSAIGQGADMAPASPAGAGTSAGTATAPGGIAPAIGNTGNASASSASGAGNVSATTPPAYASAAGTTPGAGMAAGATTGQGSNGASAAAGSATRFEPSSVPGWSMMTPQEQQAYSDRMNSATTLGQCRAFHQAAMAQMQSRARAMGQTLADRQTTDPCSAMQKQGNLQR